MTKWVQLNSTLKALFIVDMNTKRTSRIISRLIIVLFIASALNYLLFLFQGISGITQCDETSQNVTVHELFFQQNFPDFFNVLPYNLTFGIFVLVIDLLLTFAWVFNDSFIIVISFMIGKTFDLFNKRLSMNVAVRNSTFLISYVFKTLFRLE